MGKVRPIPLSATAAQRLIRETARHSERVKVIAELHDGEWRSLVDHRQAVRCLEAGAVIAKPVMDDNGNVVCTMQRYGAGELVHITVVICEHGNGGRQLIVTEYRTDADDGD